MKYLYLKLGNGNCQAEYWLNRARVKNVFNRPAVAIFFGKTTTEQCRELFKRKSEKFGKEEKPSFRDVQYQIKPFFEAGDYRNARFVIIHTQLGLIHVCEPDSAVEDMPKRLYDEYDKHLGLKGKNKTEKVHFPKVIYVKDDFRTFREFPHVLATLSCNSYLNRGTCREIRDWGAIQAIKHCLGEQLDKTADKKKLLGLLGWHQLETLVFLILKNYGIHPSAWRGGTMPQVDIIAENCSNEKITIKAKKPIEFKSRESPLEERRKTFQIKRGNVNEKKLNEKVDYTVALEFKGENEKILNAEWIVEQLETEDQKDTNDWFENSINWFY